MVTVLTCATEKIQFSAEKIHNLISKKIQLSAKKNSI